MRCTGQYNRRTWSNEKRIQYFKYGRTILKQKLSLAIFTKSSLHSLRNAEASNEFVGPNYE